MLRRVAPLLLCLIALVVPAAAGAQSSPFAPLPQPQATPAPADTTSSSSASSTDGGGLKGWQEALIFVAGAVLLLGIAWAIVGDARSVAPSEPETDGRTQSKAAREAEHKRRKAQARAANRRARSARKRNR
ncbi:hypothetical protein FSW04_16415 [Baekduia soli]|uniref:Uncharacterized protein n=1 Tax=Baekduia soli TaxID=496014 RepID=A0A5B8U7R6_9ACTN|nr:hypothetical protein [Baekduia soli]QEC48997.1 hypothetical protein FSW04_16415 [Baekduia soli]